MRENHLICIPKSTTMDAALKLKIDISNGEIVSKTEAIQRLATSELVNKLTSDITENPLFYIWRIIALSEIPEAKYLDYTKNLIDRIYNKLSTPFGFSLSGDKKMFLPCYNAMLISAMCRLGRANDEEVKRAVNWINTYQPIEKGIKISIPSFRFDRFGGCFNNTPCYIGLAKSIIALFNFQKATNDTTRNKKLQQGIEYILQHQLVKRLTNKKPITNHILDLSFPESYHLNIVELIRFAGEANLLYDERTAFAVNFLQDKKQKDGGWKINFRYKADGYIVFDNGRSSAKWLTFIISDALSNNNPNQIRHNLSYQSVKIH